MCSGYVGCWMAYCYGVSSRGGRWLGGAVYNCAEQDTCSFIVLTQQMSDHIHAILEGQHEHVQQQHWPKNCVWSHAYVACSIAYCYGVGSRAVCCSIRL
jgi:REP element-mobilizing transposase RayT